MTPKRKLTPIDYFKLAITEERMIQGAWDHEENGKHYVCLASAWGEPGTIKSVSDCPVSLFPRWVFELMPGLDDGVEALEVPWLFQGFADRAERMADFSPEQWETVRASFLIGVIDVALDAARLVQPTPIPDYWTQVQDACDQVKAALASGDGLAAEAAEAAAAAAAWAAEAAEAVAAAVAVAAAAAAAWAARAAREAAPAAARAAREAAAARATYKQIASVFFACVDEGAE